jgi:phosphoserine phosphatase
VDVQNADAVWGRIEALALAEPGGVVATDGDGTLWTGDIGEDLFHAFVAAGRCEPEATEGLRQEARDHGMSDAGGGTDIALRLYDAYREGRFPEETVCEVMTWCFAGWDRGEVRAFARDVLDRVDFESRLHVETLDLLSRARSAGIPTVLVSASPFSVVAEAGSRVGFADDQVVAARAAFAGSKMEPRVERPIPYGSVKVSRLKERLGPGQTFYAAFGDNAFDVPMLGASKVPVAVRPKARLRERAGAVPGLVELEPRGVAAATRRAR